MEDSNKDKDHTVTFMDQSSRKVLIMPNLPKPLTLDEKKYLLAVERGDMANVRRMLQKAHRKNDMNVNCTDPLGRGAISISIDAENFEMLELLIVMGVETKDALLQAIKVEFVEAVELLLEHEELIHKEGELYSWEKVDFNIGTFPPDVTPLMLAAHTNNYEILKILLDRGATLPMPHDIKCGCEICLRESKEDSLRFSMSRVNEYRALSSPSLIALSSNDPILTAFQLSWELRNLAFTEQESKINYLELRKQCQQFAVDLLDQTRSSQELAIILNHDPDSVPYEEGEHMKLGRLELAIQMKQKKFVAHPNVQQLLAALWYEGLPGFRRKKSLSKFFEICKIALLFPFYCTWYMLFPTSSLGKLIKNPFMKFLIHASSYLFFLLLLILVSQRADILLIEMFGTDAMKKNLDEEKLRQRGNMPTALEWLIVLYVLGFIWEEVTEIYHGGFDEYKRDLWNIIDFTRNSLYVLVLLFRIFAFFQQSAEIASDPSSAYIPREAWEDFDPHLVAEGLFAAANIFSALKLVHLFSVNPHLGPLQISLGRMVIDIIKFFSIYSLVLFAFACGLNQLLSYFADLERRKCYVREDGLPDWDHHGDSCTKWRRFGSLFESSQSLFWASFGMIGIENFDLAGIKTYTRFWGLLMFGSYSVINVIVLLNLLIAMMSNSYTLIEEHSDTEWKFARTRLWMSYIEESCTLPPPFNIFPTPKLILKLLGIRKKDKLRRMSSKKKEKKEKDRDYRYTAVMRALVWRYISDKHRENEESPVTEDDINEVKGEISAMKYDLLEVLGKNGMDVSSSHSNQKSALGRKMKVWERRLMKDFHVAPVASEEEVDQLMQAPPENEEPLDKFRRIAKLAVMNSAAHKWGEVVEGAVRANQIGRSIRKESFKNQQYLLRAMDEARKFICNSPLPQGPFSPVLTPDITAGTLMELLNDFKEESHATKDRFGSSPFLSVQNLPRSRGTTPNMPAFKKSKLQEDIRAGVVPTVSHLVSSAADEPTPLKQIKEEVAPKVHKKKAPIPVVLDQGFTERSQAPSLLTQMKKDQVEKKKADSPPVPKRQFNKIEQRQSIFENKTKIPQSPKREITSSFVPRPNVEFVGHKEGSSFPPPPRKQDDIKTEIKESIHQKFTPPTIHISPSSTIKSSRSPSPQPSETVSSTELLIGSEVRPVNKIGDVNTIKRKPKSGWL